MIGGLLAGREPDDVRELADGLDARAGRAELTVDHAPGHTEGSVMFRRAADAGDAADPALGRRALRRLDRAHRPARAATTPRCCAASAAKVLPLDDETVVLPGHGPHDDDRPRAA